MDERSEPDSAHEALCQRCGVSCHMGVDVELDGGVVRVVLDELRCRFLRTRDGRAHCSVYAERFERAPWCATVEQSLDEGWLRQDCPYVAVSGKRDYRGKNVLTDEWHARLRPLVREQILAEGAPLGADEEGLAALVGPGFRFEPDGECLRAIETQG